MSFMYFNAILLTKKAKVFAADMWWSNSAIRKKKI